MKIKEDAEISTSDFWYDLTDGGYLKPDEICENPADAEKVKQAIAILMDFKESCENQEDLLDYINANEGISEYMPIAEYKCPGKILKEKLKSIIDNLEVRDDEK